MKGIAVNGENITQFVWRMGPRGSPLSLPILPQKSVLLSLLTKTMPAEKKEMTPVIREYTINLNKACHKV